MKRGNRFEADCYSEQTLIAAFEEILKMVSEHPCRVIATPVGDKRTIEQNARYHAIVNQIAAQVKCDGELLHRDAWHEWIKKKFIGSYRLRMPDGSLHLQGISTTSLTVEEFSRFMDTVEAWASTEAGVTFANLPGEDKRK